MKRGILALLLLLLFATGCASNLTPVRPFPVSITVPPLSATF
jgi:hypothetical protein